ncbi:hypothetical protein GF342_00755 [Candidatus Woesearchaeota archaeon]|nr:hypothetical protein [Candidatus Woesearchaeota archaeon]
MERTYIIPLRKEWRKTVKCRRAKKTIRAIREFLQKHMKTDDVRIGKHLNEEVWKHGIKNPPSKVRVNARKEKEGHVICELFGKELPKKVEEPKKKSTVEKLKDKVGKDTPKTAKKETVKEEKTTKKDDKKDEKKENTAKKEVTEKKSAEKDAEKKSIADKKPQKPEERKTESSKDNPEKKVKESSQSESKKSEKPDQPKPVSK